MIKLITNIKKLKKISYTVDIEKAKKTVMKLKLKLNELKDKAIGLCAPQIGLYERVICFANNYSNLVLINPEIIKRSDDMVDSIEACLSLPKTLKDNFKLRRYKKIKVKYMDYSGNTKVMKFDHIYSRSIQHEIDHLNGILIIDK